jgi:excisionase family DNA binding protein
MGEPQHPAGTDYLRVAEVAAAMHVPRMTVYELVQDGKLPAVSFGKSYRVPAQAVQEYLAAARHPEAVAHLHAPT